MGSSVFAGHIRVTDTQTNTQTTLRATSVATDYIYAMHVTRPINITNDSVQAEQFLNGEE